MAIMEAARKASCLVYTQQTLALLYSASAWKSEIPTLLLEVDANPQIFLVHEMEKSQTFGNLALPQEPVTLESLPLSALTVL